MQGMIMLIHIVTGTVALVTGAIALSLAATKASRFHKSSGRLFVYAMLVMSVSGIVTSILRDIPTNAIGGTVAIYMVLTAWMTVHTVRPSAPIFFRIFPTTRPYSTWIHWVLMIMGIAITLWSMSVAVEIRVAGKFARHGVPFPILLFFGGVMLLASVGDIRRIQATTAYTVHQRLKRHLWRMCFGFWIATGSFFLGQAKIIPEPFRIPWLLAVLAFLPLVVMIYWFWHLRKPRLPRQPLHIPLAQDHESPIVENDKQSFLPT